MAKKSTEVAARVAAEVAVVDQQALAALASGEGFEDVQGRDMFAVPFLVVLQPLSPQCNPAAAEHVEGAIPGRILHTVSNELFSTVQVVPVHLTRTFVEWVPRDAGGGFRGEHAGPDAIELFNSKLDRTTGKARLDNGNDLVDTRNHYVLVVREDGHCEPALISMSSTQIKASKQWTSMMQMFRPVSYQLPPGVLPAMYACAYNLTTVLQENKKGKWFGWRVTRLQEILSADIINAAKSFRRQILGGEVAVDRSVAEAASEDDNAM